MLGKRSYKLLFTAILSVAFLSCALAQEKKSKGLSLKDRKVKINQHAFFLEAGGSGFIYSFNYETLLLNRGTTRWYARLGMEWLPFKHADKLLHFPLLTSVTFGRSRWQPEVGFGALFRINLDPGTAFGEGYFLTEPPTNIFLTPTLGVKWISKADEYGDTWMMKFGFTPLLGMDIFAGRSYFQPWAGISFGRTWSNHNRKK